ncbi:MAG TPA: hypothetical protein VK631_26085 [Solirubrobacteraceae bacterium]|nr:hypothetical protein [Solirubrobacteraceae bacterium]
MRDLIVTENITLDGVIEATEGWFDPAGGETGGDIVTTGSIRPVHRSRSRRVHCHGAQVRASGAGGGVACRGCGKSTWMSSPPSVRAWIRRSAWWVSAIAAMRFCGVATAG